VLGLNRVSLGHFSIDLFRMSCTVNKGCETFHPMPTLRSETAGTKENVQTLSNHPASQAQPRHRPRHKLPPTLVTRSSPLTTYPNLQGDVKLPTRLLNPASWFVHRFHSHLAISMLTMNMLRFVSNSTELIYNSSGLARLNLIWLRRWNPKKSRWSNLTNSQAKDNCRDISA
jgi:hypothetical protein